MSDSILIKFRMVQRENIKSFNLKIYDNSNKKTGKFKNIQWNISKVIELNSNWSVT